MEVRQRTFDLTPISAEALEEASYEGEYPPPTQLVEAIPVDVSTLGDDTYPGRDIYARVVPPTGYQDQVTRSFTPKTSNRTPPHVYLSTTGDYGEEITDEGLGPGVHSEALASRRRRRIYWFAMICGPLLIAMIGGLIYGLVRTQGGNESARYDATSVSSDRESTPGSLTSEDFLGSDNGSESGSVVSPAPIVGPTQTTMEPTDFPVAVPSFTVSFPSTGVSFPSSGAYNTRSPSPQDLSTNAPTPAPSIKPEPTARPAQDAPSPRPASAPTNRPQAPIRTNRPDPEPTRRPVASPTRNPAVEDASQPIRGPTAAPRKTRPPTIAPTKAPTLSPTRRPTSSPSRHPVAQPTQRPVLATIPPAFLPKDRPILGVSDPTRSPTDSPTRAPTKSPTHRPTKRPTQPPTLAPTGSPTDSPTKRHTMPPTDMPTKYPTRSPTSAPTLPPTPALTMTPTSDPTHTESLAPTAGPTLPLASPEPSSQPSAAVATPSPTPRPSVETGSPTMAPLFYTDFRFQAWNDLSLADQSLALQAGYDNTSWDSPGRNPIENFLFSKLFEEAGEDVLSALSNLGFTTNSWDCWVNHYAGDSWEGLISRDKVEAYEVLGWTAETWASQDPFEWPESELKLWYELSADQRQAAEELCYMQELWDGISLDDWESVNTARIDFVEILERRASTSLEVLLEDMDSAQHRGFLWVTSSSWYSSYGEDRLLQRWVLAVLALSVTGARNSNDSKSLRYWVGRQDECEEKPPNKFDPTICNLDGKIESIQAADAGLYGTLPPELSLLGGSLSKLILSPRTSISRSLESRY